MESQGNGGENLQSNTYFEPILGLGAGIVERCTILHIFAIKLKKKLNLLCNLCFEFVVSLLAVKFDNEFWK